MTCLAYLNTSLIPALILFGNDQACRLRAAWFTSNDLVVASASGALGYVALRVTNNEGQSKRLSDRPSSTRAAARPSQAARLRMR